MKWASKCNARDWISYRYRNVPFSTGRAPAKGWTGKAIPVQDWKGPVCSRRLRLPDFIIQAPEFQLKNLGSVKDFR